MSEHLTEPVGLSTSTFERWLRPRRPDLLADGPLRATILDGGRSNLTYQVTGGAAPLVLRRPPLGHVLSTAHDMAREHRVISALAPASVPVPRAELHHDDSDGSAGVGTPFYVMELVEGVVLRSPADNAQFSAPQLRALSLDLAATLGRLHSLDPQSVGLGSLGRPDGFLTRQARRWGEQYDRSRSRPLPQLDQLQDELRASIPATTRTSILHGDYRLDNAIVQVGPDGAPTLAAILDWEMATLGDSLTDLGLLALYWDIRTLSGEAMGAAASAVDPAAGYPSFDELVDVYSATRRAPVPKLAWYRAFAAYKLAIILEGIHYRHLAGETVGPGFDTVGALVAPLAAHGLASLGPTRTGAR
ncbi:phosphotransferase family protein [Cellulomonas timonensis]|uniref:phosphotransferase family protein n=1 Tax=Cellulomonas timonensis TaxID=1689271 RepID=UPI000A3D9C17|nr:phosphotransferase family protein [Cellulomonas timonensis]